MALEKCCRQGYTSLLNSIQISSGCTAPIGTRKSSRQPETLHAPYSILQHFVVILSQLAHSRLDVWPLRTTKNFPGSWSTPVSANSHSRVAPSPPWQCSTASMCLRPKQTRSGIVWPSRTRSWQRISSAGKARCLDVVLGEAGSQGHLCKRR